MDSPTRQRIDEIKAEARAANTVKAHKADMKYFWGWVELAHKRKEHYPVSKELLIGFLLNHIDGMPPALDSAMIAKGYKAKPGLLSVATVARRINSISTAHALAGHPSPTKHFEVRQLLSSARRKAARAGHRPRKSKAITKWVLDRMIKTIPAHTLQGKRDKALLMFGFYTGGRRRSEIAQAQYCHLTKVAEGYHYLLPRSKTDQEGKGKIKLLRVRQAKALTAWINAAEIKGGHIFRRIYKNGKVSRKPIRPRAVSAICKLYIERMGFDPKEYSAHGLRRGFITTCGRQGIPLPDVMDLTDHKDYRIVLQYYEEGRLSRNPATKI